jgi:hypothetical protein
VLAAVPAPLLPAVGRALGDALPNAAASCVDTAPTVATAADVGYLLAAARLQAFYAAPQADNPALSAAVPALAARPEAYLRLLCALHDEAPGANVLAVEAVKKLAADCLLAAPAAAAAAAVAAAVRHLQSASAAAGGANSYWGRCPALAVTTEVVSGVLRALQDDVATLRRVSRVPDASGIDCKALLRGGEALFDLALGVHADAAAAAACFEHQREGAMRELGPYLFPPTVPSWARALGRAWDVAAPELHFHHICHACSVHASGAGAGAAAAAGDDAGVWQPLAAEVAAAVRRLRPEHVHALALGVAGIDCPPEPFAFLRGARAVVPLGAAAPAAPAAILAGMEAALERTAATTSAAGAPGAGAAAAATAAADA